MNNSNIGSEVSTAFYILLTKRSCKLVLSEINKDCLTGCPLQGCSVCRFIGLCDQV